jgi:hypothetical protein
MENLTRPRDGESDRPRGPEAVIARGPRTPPHRLQKRAAQSSREVEWSDLALANGQDPIPLLSIRPEPAIAILQGRKNWAIVRAEVATTSRSLPSNDLAARGGARDPGESARRIDPCTPGFPIGQGWRYLDGRENSKDRSVIERINGSR